MEDFYKVLDKKIEKNNEINRRYAGIEEKANKKARYGNRA